MIKKNLFKNLILSASIVSSVVMVGCATNNVATNDTEVSVEVVSASDIMADEDVNETADVVADDTGAVTDEETVEIKSETSNENKTVSSEKVGKTEDKSVSGSTNAGSAVSTTKTTGATETVKPSSTEGKVADSKIASGNSNGTIASSKPAGIPTSVPNNGKTTKPAEVAKSEVVGTNNTQSKTTASANRTGSVNGSNKDSNGSSASNKDYGWVDSYGVRHGGYTTQEEADAAVIAYANERKNSYTTTVTVNNGVTDAMNKYREENGKAAVSSNERLDEIAKKRAEELASDFSHNSASDSYAGNENIQANYGGGATSEQVVENYSESFGHNGTMLDAYGSASSATATVTDADGNVVAQYDVTVFDEFDDNSVERVDGPPEGVDFDPSWMN